MRCVNCYKVNLRDAAVIPIQDTPSSMDIQQHSSLSEKNWELLSADMKLLDLDNGKRFENVATLEQRKKPRKSASKKWSTNGRGAKTLVKDSSSPGMLEVDPKPFPQVRKLAGSRPKGKTHNEVIAKPTATGWKTI